MLRRAEHLRLSLLDKPEDWLPAENDKVVAALQLIAEEVVDSVKSLGLCAGGSTRVATLRGT